MAVFYTPKCVGLRLYNRCLTLIGSRGYTPTNVISRKIHSFLICMSAGCANKDNYSKERNALFVRIRRVFINLRAN